MSMTCSDVEQLDVSAGWTPALQAEQLRWLSATIMSLWMPLLVQCVQMCVLSWRVQSSEGLLRGMRCLQEYYLSLCI